MNTTPTNQPEDTTAPVIATPEPNYRAAPVREGYGIRIDIEFDGPIDPDVAHVLGTATARAFATMTKPAFVRALVELI